MTRLALLELQLKQLNLDADDLKTGYQLVEDSVELMHGDILEVKRLQVEVLKQLADRGVGVWVTKNNAFLVALLTLASGLVASQLRCTPKEEGEGAPHATTRTTTAQEVEEGVAPQ